MQNCQNSEKDMLNEFKNKYEKMLMDKRENRDNRYWASISKL